MKSVRNKILVQVPSIMWRIDHRIRRWANSAITNQLGPQMDSQVWIPTTGQINKITR